LVDVMAEDICPANMHAESRLSRPGCVVEPDPTSPGFRS
jgi:hypothetical protein